MSQSVGTAANSLRIPMFKRLNIRDEGFLEIEKRSIRAGFYSLVLSIFTIYFGIIDLYSIMTTTCSPYYVYYISSGGHSKYCSKLHGLNKLIILAIIPVLLASPVFFSSIILLTALREDYKKKIDLWLYCFGTFTLFNLLSCLYFATFIDEDFIISFWTALTLFNNSSWTHVYSGYTEFYGNSPKRNDLLFLMMCTASCTIPVLGHFVRLFGYRFIRLQKMFRNVVIKSYNDLRKGSIIAGVYSLLLSIVSIFLGLYNIYSLVSARCSTYHGYYIILSYQSVYIGSLDVRGTLILIAIYSAVSGVVLLIFSVMLITAPREVCKEVIVLWLYCFSIYTILSLFSWIFLAFVTDLILIVSRWTVFNVANNLVWFLIHLGYFKFCITNQRYDLSLLMACITFFTIPVVGWTCFLIVIGHK